MAAIFNVNRLLLDLFEADLLPYKIGNDVTTTKTVKGKRITEVLREAAVLHCLTMIELVTNRDRREWGVTEGNGAGHCLVSF